MSYPEESLYWKGRVMNASQSEPVLSSNGQGEAAKTKPVSINCEPMYEDAEGWSEWIHPLPGYRMQCCDCNLIHEMQFEIAENTIHEDRLNPGEDEQMVVVFRARRAPP